MSLIQEWIGTLPPSVASGIRKMWACIDQYSHDTELFPHPQYRDYFKRILVLWTRAFTIVRDYDISSDNLKRWESMCVSAAMNQTQLALLGCMYADVDLVLRGRTFQKQVAGELALATRDRVRRGVVYTNVVTAQHKINVGVHAA